MDVGLLAENLRKSTGWEVGIIEDLLSYSNFKEGSILLEYFYFLLTVHGKGLADYGLEKRRAVLDTVDLVDGFTR